MDWARRNAWRLYLVVSGVLVALYYLVARIDSLPWRVADAQGTLWAIIAVLTVAGMCAGIWLHQPSSRSVWVCFVLAVAATGIADTLWEFPEWIGLKAGNIPFPSVLDYIYLASYVFLFAGIAILAHRSPGKDRAALLDALIVTIAAGLTSWIFIIEPTLASGTDSISGNAVSAAYPVMDLLLLGAATRLWFSVDSGRNTSMRLIVLTLVGVLISDTAYTYLLTQNSWSDGTVWDFGWFIFYMGLGAAALHPSVAAPAVATTPERSVSPWRFVLLLGLTAILPLVLLVAKTSGDTQMLGLVVVLGAVAMFLLVLLRLNDLVKQLHETLRRERVIRDANRTLAAATDSESIRDTVVEAAADLHASATSFLVKLRRNGQVAVVTKTSGPAGRRALGEHALRVLAQLAQDDVLMYGPTALHSDLGLHPQTAVTATSLIDNEGKSEAYLVAGGHPTLPREAPPALAALAEAASLATARVGLGRVLADRASEERLRRMLQHSTDIIAVLDLDLSIRYLSPGAERLLGAPPHHIHGSSWLDVVFPADRGKANDIIEASSAERPAHSEFRLLAGDGSHRYVDVVATRVVEYEEPGFVLTCHDITERRTLEQQLSYQAFHDSLTGLANRALFRDRLVHALSRISRTAATFAVLFIDLDDFKDVNDSLGHAAGDAMLRQMTQRLLAAVREHDTVARLGGDEFAILLESIESQDEVVAVADRIVVSAREPFELDESIISTGLSIGIAIADHNTDSAESVMRNADLALYEAKSLGKNRFAIFAPAMHEQAVDRLQLSADLRRAIDDSELVVHYQPIVELMTYRLLGVEALVRWQHPTRGLLGPAQFIGLAEESGLIVPLGREVMRIAFADAMSWRRQFPALEHLTVTVNLSARQLQEDTLVSDVSQALSNAELPADRVVLEITESMLLPSEGVTVERLDALADLGVRLFIDDFGTGYSSLSYLQQLPVHGIKLAREFVDSLQRSDNARDGSKLVSTIKGIAETFGLSSIIAEGVETPEQRVALLKLGYTIGQGYLMARPMSASSITSLLSQGPAVVPMDTESLAATRR